MEQSPKLIRLASLGAAGPPNVVGVSQLSFPPSKHITRNQIVCLLLFSINLPVCGILLDIFLRLIQCLYLVSGLFLYSLYLCMSFVDLFFV